MTERKVFWPQIKQEARKAGINKVMSFPISDKNESEYMDDLFAAAQHLNDLINEQKETVYLYDNSGMTRAPTLVMAYLCLYRKTLYPEKTAEAQKIVSDYHQVSTPNTAVVQKLLKKHKAFQDRQRII